LTKLFWYLPLIAIAIAMRESAYCVGYGNTEATS
jgi:hypothetical protein